MLSGNENILLTLVKDRLRGRVHPSGYRASQHGLTVGEKIKLYPEHG